MGTAAGLPAGQAPKSGSYGDRVRLGREVGSKFFNKPLYVPQPLPAEQAAATLARCERRRTETRSQFGFPVCNILQVFYSEGEHLSHSSWLAAAWRRQKRGGKKEGAKKRGQKRGGKKERTGGGE